MKKAKTTIKKAAVLTAATMLAVSSAYPGIAVAPTGLVQAQAAENVKEGTCGENVTYKLDSEGVLTISGSGNMEDYGDLNHDAPWGNSDLKKVVIEDGVTSIGRSAFESCSLKNIEIADSVTSIGSHAFADCTNLESIKISENVTNLGYCAFVNCTSLTSAEILGKVDIGSSEFERCRSLTSIKLAEGVTSIGLQAFQDCESLSSIELPESITKIDSNAFTRCTSLTEVKIPNGVTEMSSSVFSYCTSLTGIEIPASVTKIGSNPVIGCINLTGIKVDENNTAYDSRENCNAIISTEDNSLLAGCMNTKIPDSVTAIDGVAFQHCDGLTEITIPSGVTSIGRSAFYGCRGLTSIALPDGVTEVGISAFEDCSNLSRIEIPASVASVGWRVFYGCRGDLKIVGESGSYIESYAAENNMQFIEKNMENKGNSWYTDKDGNTYWFENGVKQGTTGRGKEIYDAESNAWYWLDAVSGGQKAVSKDVYQDSLAGVFGENPAYSADGTIDVTANTGKWVRYDENGHMVKGWDENANGKYYFDTVYGTMAKGYATIDGKEYYFNPNTGVLEREVTDGIADFTGWKTIDGADYWYENGIRQGYSHNTAYRGKEVFDAESNAWYWLDNADGGKKAISKDVFQGSKADDAGNIGKWVRYDENGHMVKGWDENAGGKYYFDTVYGTMYKGTHTIDGTEYTFDEVTGRLIR